MFQKEQAPISTTAQLRAARALIGWSQALLASQVGVSTMTIKRAEGSGKPLPGNETLLSIREVLEGAGVIFLCENGDGPGVRLSKRS